MTALFIGGFAYYLLYCFRTGRTHSDAVDCTSCSFVVLSRGSRPAPSRLGTDLGRITGGGGNECPVTQHQTTERGRIKRSRQLPRTPANTTADLPDVSRARINSDKLPRGIGSRRTPHKTDAAAGGIGKERRRDKKDPGDAGRRPGIAAGRSGRQRRTASSCGPMKQR